MSLIKSFEEKQSVDELSKLRLKVQSFVDEHNIQLAMASPTVCITMNVFLK